MSKQSRRRFLGNGIAAGATAGLLVKTSTSALGKTATPPGVLRCGIIGCGMQAEALRASALPLQRYVRFVAVADLSARELRYAASRIKASRQGAGERSDVCGEYEDAEIMLAEEELDAVIIATPPAFHHRYTVTALEKGVNVYCEKPMAHTVEQGREMVAAQKRTGETTPDRSPAS